jgi:hypothetical protein
MTSNEYYVISSRYGEHPERWRWEIRRKSKPLGVKLTADGFQSEAAAKFAGKGSWMNSYQSFPRKNEGPGKWGQTKLNHSRC